MKLAFLETIKSTANKIFSKLKKNKPQNKKSDDDQINFDETSEYVSMDEQSLKSEWSKASADNEDSKNKKVTKKHPKINFNFDYRIFLVIIASVIVLAIIAVGIGFIIAPKFRKNTNNDTSFESFPKLTDNYSKKSKILPDLILIPELDYFSYPLAQEQKQRYTEQDAAQVRPDLSEIDVSSLTEQRKAWLEKIFSAVP